MFKGETFALELPLFTFKANQGTRKLSYFIEFNEVLSKKRRFESVHIWIHINYLFNKSNGLTFMDVI